MMSGLVFWRYGTTCLQMYVSLCRDAKPPELNNPTNRVGMNSSTPLGRLNTTQAKLCKERAKDFGGCDARAA